MTQLPQDENTSDVCVGRGFKKQRILKKKYKRKLIKDTKRIT